MQDLSKKHQHQFQQKPIARQLDGPWMLKMNLHVVDTIHPQSSKFVTGVKIKARVESHLNDNPDI